MPYEAYPKDKERIQNFKKLAGDRATRARGLELAPLLGRAEIFYAITPPF